MLKKENNHFSFRPATLHDAALLTDLGWRSFVEAFGAKNKPEDMEEFKPTMYSLELQTEELVDPATEFIIVEAEEVPVGYVKLNTDIAPEEIKGNKPLLISRFYLLQKWTGHGLGDRLMRQVLDRAQRREHDVVWLTVWSENERAIRFYQKHGFIKTGELNFVLGQDIQLDYYMQRKVII